MLCPEYPNFFTLLGTSVAPKLIQILSMSQYGMVWVAQLAHLKPCPLCHTEIRALPVAPQLHCGLPAVPWQTWQPLPLPQSASTASPKQDPSYNVLVDSGMPQSLLRSPSVAWGFWSVILYHPVWERRWARYGLAQSRWFWMGFVPKQAEWHGPSNWQPRPQGQIMLFAMWPIIQWLSSCYQYALTLSSPLHII